jgi:hypothetical protein
VRECLSLLSAVLILVPAWSLLKLAQRFGILPDEEENV